jgi:integrase
MATGTTNRSRHTGIEARHTRSCPANNGGRCGCAPSYRATVYSKREKRTIRKSFRNLAEAKAWRADAQAAVRKGALTASRTPTLREAAEGWVAGAESGAIRNRSGDVYKPSVVRGYEQALRLRVLPDFGSVALGDIGRPDLQALVDRMLRDGQGASTIRNTLLPVRAIFRRALVRGEVAVNPTAGLELPAVRGRRDRVASPREAEQLLEALTHDRALWAMAFYTGLRMGELRALEWDDVDLDRGIVRVRRTWDHKAGPVAPKSAAGRRVVPLGRAVRESLAEHRRQSNRRDGLVFGRSATVPFAAWTVNERAKRAWDDAGLRRITLHECRHTFASFMIAAGVNAKALCVFMGHSSVTVTYDLYGHLMPGSEAEAAGLLDAYLEP